MKKVDAVPKIFEQFFVRNHGEVLTAAAAPVPLAFFAFATFAFLLAAPVPAA
jgi:hypothetical protein